MSPLINIILLVAGSLLAICLLYLVITIVLTLLVYNSHITNCLAAMISFNKISVIGYYDNCIYGLTIIKNKKYLVKFTKLNTLTNYTNQIDANTLYYFLLNDDLEIDKAYLKFTLCSILITLFFINRKIKKLDAFSDTNYENCIFHYRDDLQLALNKANRINKIDNLLKDI